MNPCQSIFVCIIIAVIAGTSRTEAGRFELPDLPYGYEALEPIISEKTLRTHHLKHHAKYVNTANALLEKQTDVNGLSQEQIIKTQNLDAGLFNNVAQSWNHQFYWSCMKPGGGGVVPAGSPLATAIDKDFGSFDKFRQQMETAALTAFGSGWAWLGYDTDNQKLVITKTTGAGNPMTIGITPILTIDVWEHAYYLDYQEKRPAYVKAYFDKLVNWDFAALNYAAAMSKAKGADEL